MLEVKNLSTELKNFSIQNISLTIEKGEYFVILGPNGAGKTLLLETLAGFHYPSSGKIIIDGIDVTFFPPENRNIGFVYQDFMLFPHYKVYDNLAFGLKLRKKKNIRKKVEEVANLLDIATLLDREPATLSGGEKQRVTLARVLVIEPGLLLLDEPLSSVDVPTKKRLQRELKDLHETTRITTLHVTHEQEEALVLGNRIGIMSDGKLVQVGTPTKIFREPNSKFVADFVGVENIFPGFAVNKGEITEVDLGWVLLRSTAKKSGKVNASIRPEDIIISCEKMHTSTRNVFQGKLLEIRDKGSIIELLVDCKILFKVFITRQSFFELGINVGSTVYLNFKAQAVHLF